MVVIYAIQSPTEKSVGLLFYYSFHYFEERRLQDAPGEGNMGLEFGTYYHISNRRNNRESLFYEERNYNYFLELYKKYIPQVAKTFAYCLLPNHFHFLIQVNTEDEQRKTSSSSKPINVVSPSGQFSNLFNAYAKAINKSNNRRGSLFQD